MSVRYVIPVFVFTSLLNLNHLAKAAEPYTSKRTLILKNFPGQLSLTDDSGSEIEVASIELSNTRSRERDELALIAEPAELAMGTGLQLGEGTRRYRREPYDNYGRMEFYGHYLPDPIAIAAFPRYQSARQVFVRLQQMFDDGFNLQMRHASGGVMLRTFDSAEQFQVLDESATVSTKLLWLDLESHRLTFGHDVAAADRIARFDQRSCDFVLVRLETAFRQARAQRASMSEAAD